MDYALANIWYSYFKKKVIGNCEQCGNKVRITKELSKILNINNFDNLKYPEVFWKNETPICYICHDNTQFQCSSNNNILARNNYLQNWYVRKGYCYHGNNIYKLCGNKDIYCEGLCEKHYNSMNSICISKKSKFI